MESAGPGIPAPPWASALLRAAGLKPGRANTFPTAEERDLMVAIVAVLPALPSDVEAEWRATISATKDVEKRRSRRDALLSDTLFFADLRETTTAPPQVARVPTA